MDPKLEMEIQMGLTRAAEMGKTVLFPEKRRFTELFSSGRVITNLAVYHSHEVFSWELDEGGEVHIISYCGVDSPTVRITLDVQPREEIAEAIHSNMIMSRGYRISFEINAREGTALVSAKYDRILGSRWLAFIDSSTIPGLREAEAREEQVADEPDEPVIEEMPVLDLFGMES
jgi:hypothetical protein